MVSSVLAGVLLNRRPDTPVAKELLLRLVDDAHNVLITVGTGVPTSGLVLSVAS